MTRQATEAASLLPRAGARLYGVPGRALPHPQCVATTWYKHGGASVPHRMHSGQQPGKLGKTSLARVPRACTSRFKSCSLNRLLFELRAGLRVAGPAPMSTDVDGTSVALPLFVSAAPGKAETPTKGLKNDSSDQIDLAPPSASLEEPSASGVPIVERVEKPVRPMTPMGTQSLPVACIAAMRRVVPARPPHIHRLVSLR